MKIKRETQFQYLVTFSYLLEKIKTGQSIQYYIFQFYVFIPEAQAHIMIE